MSRDNLYCTQKGMVVWLFQVLQSLGKADKSTDESFDDLVQKTEKQHVGKFI